MGGEGSGGGGPARARGEAHARKDRARGGARARKDRARGSSTGALCTRFTLVLMIGPSGLLLVVPTYMQFQFQFH